MARRLALWGPVALWAGLLFFLSSRSDLGLVGQIPDWITHGMSYTAFAMLLARALAGGFFRPLAGRTAFAVVLAVTLYGVSDEWHQSFVPGRDSSAGDVAKDAGGALFGVLLFRRLASRSGAAS